MKIREKTELVAMIIGMLMIIAGVFYFLSKVRIESDFFSGGSDWPLWASFASLVPLIAGIVTMLVFPKNWIPRIVGIVGAVAVIILIAYHTTLYLKTRLAGSQWALLGILLIGGLAVIVVTLFVKKKEHNEKR